MRNNSYLCAILGSSIIFGGAGSFVNGSGDRKSNITCGEIPRENLETILKNGSYDECLPQQNHTTQVVGDNNDYFNGLYINPAYSLKEQKAKEKNRETMPNIFPVVIVYTGGFNNIPMTWDRVVVDMRNNPNNYVCFVTEEGKKRYSGGGIEAQRFHNIVPDAIVPNVFPAPYNVDGASINDVDMVKFLPVKLKPFPEE